MDNLQIRSMVRHISTSCRLRVRLHPTGESPVMPIARFRYVAISQFMWVTAYPLRDVNDPAPEWRVAAVKLKIWKPKSVLEIYCYLNMGKPEDLIQSILIII